MTHKTLRRTLMHGYCGEFRVETLESQAPGVTQWLSTAFVYHRDRAAPVATIEGAGQGECAESRSGRDQSRQVLLSRCTQQ
ncbi:hypothetical protein BRM22_07815 [Xanthomonas oryzae pv. oryzae]|uniref:hypothetical protein n=1 Tax=Xanthomonas oryzae TaxID=347 RepID=UPI00006791B1|nr:hypothetical protein [Xanthomonas oryzae]AOS03246.1 hypothetical protein ATY42_15400 [Xanthomonas oryzae pv. oryzae]AOS19886.1 hypothetical protein ATY46_15690 [Xanthomonas oryzae pv. oryzae]AOS24044.1 hypothetical protein ATY47_15625 [Xanthomonas oryzae pv. oryzae]AOS28203.1 hypothetical protein ATY48_15545 [Xanthomonas oryzae pv. oryzae]AQU46197.1 hypothetical protein ABM06_15615 [Xanthomonas oryzae pv. oryzae]